MDLAVYATASYRQRNFRLARHIPVVQKFKRTYELWKCLNDLSLTGGAGRASVSSTCPPAVDCQSFSDRNLKRFSAGGADAAEAELAADADDAYKVAVGT